MQLMREKGLMIKGKVIKGKPMKELTSLKIGGLADLFVIPEDSDDLRVVLDFCARNKTPFLLIGNGSKLLVRDEGFRGVVIKLGNGFRKIQEYEEGVIVGAGVDLPTLINLTAERGLSGLESLAGIPGTVGGAVVRNASAFGEALSERIVWVKVMDTNNSGFILKREEINFGYRSSLFLENKNLVLTEVKLRLFPDKKEKIILRVNEATRKKMQTQPLSYPSAGCIFKNPPYYSAGYLIQNTGCLGMRVGDAQVSFQHGNFIINKGRAKASDIIQLIERIKKRVKEKFNITLEPEVEII
ncbi:UDP-N-acetylmuramate dehydrogenase [Candidatus Aerophobetes bacterium]|uniref:UDP-N-acetylenolpyruvoylglucosamine reductase n=1 Tax=Aerophobetes bacterium TaxID=2030807 RepID=A0A7V0N0R9_UNCAE|nr:UDP-N-acetylmuramate dehydrogenase [Candidatus Aerophobetes bacterium]HDN84626.1 UDP-N-acetylmuramate dehydrogenase [Candidatus Aerophobetes bacterium]